MTVTQVTTYKNYIGGQWLDSVSGNSYLITNPASKDTVLGRFQVSNPEDAGRAVAAAPGSAAGLGPTHRRRYGLRSCIEPWRS